MAQAQVRVVAERAMAMVVKVTAEAATVRVVAGKGGVESACVVYACVAYACVVYACVAYACVVAAYANDNSSLDNNKHCQQSCKRSLNNCTTGRILYHSKKNRHQNNQGATHVHGHCQGPP